MIVAFANNQVIVAEAGTPSVITTDPVPMNDSNNAAAIPSIHYLYGGTTRSLTYKAQLSNDGVVWVDSTSVTDSLNATGVGALKEGECRAAFIRFEFSFSVTGSGQGAVCFDLHVRLDRE